MMHGPRRRSTPTSNAMTEKLAHLHGPPQPSNWVKRFLPGIARGGHVLDVACGAGRHIWLALENGYRVTGIDRDLSAAGELMGRPEAELIEADLEDGGPFPFKGRIFDGVIVANYLWRPILADIIACVADDGVLIYETFALGHERHGRPSRPEFLLKPNELIEAVLPHLAVIAYEHGVIEGRRPKIVQRIAACGKAHEWAGRGPVSL